MKVILNEHLLFALEELINTAAEIAVIKPKIFFKCPASKTTTSQAKRL